MACDLQGGAGGSGARPEQEEVGSEVWWGGSGPDWVSF